MAETTTKEEKELTVTHEDGTVSTLNGTITTTDHGVTDEGGNPKVSVHIAVSPPETPAPEPVHLNKE